jgi:hypothetical protein
LLTPLLPLALWACEDGPNQTFAPATGTAFNAGDSPALTDEAGAPLTANYGGTTKQEICSGSQLQDEWSKMIHQPIVPPRFMAGFDLAGGDQFPGLTVESVEQGPLSPVMGAANPPDKLCQPTVEGPGGDSGDIGGSLQVHWGNNSEVQMEWAIPTHKAYLVNLNVGYLGTMEWDYTTSTDDAPVDAKGNLLGNACCNADAGSTCKAVDQCGKHHYVWQIGQVTTKDGQPYFIHWGAGNSCGKGSVCDRETNELYKGIVSQFVPDLYQNLPNVTCIAAGNCLISPSGNDGTGAHPIVGFRPAAFYMETFNPAQSLQAGSTMWQAYVFAIKFAPYWNTATVMKMDAPGTYSFGFVGDKLQPCTLSLGDSFDSLYNNCINAFSSGAATQQALNKVIGNIGHDDQNFTFSLVAVAENFFPMSLSIGGARQFDVIHDNETPADQNGPGGVNNRKDNVAGTFTYDVRASGPIVNEGFFKNPAKLLNAANFAKDYHGSGAVWREWGRLMQGELAAAWAKLHPRPASVIPDSIATGHWPRPWHDPQCMYPMQCTDNASGKNNGMNYDECAADVDAKGNALASYGMPHTTGCYSTVTNNLATDTLAFDGTTHVAGIPLAKRAAWEAACEAHTDAASCNADNTNYCVYWTGPLGWRNPDGCTGIEGIVHGGNADADATALTYEPSQFAVGGGGPIGTVGNEFRPGNPGSQFCNDPGVGNFCGASGDIEGVTSDTIGGPYQRALQYMGKGNIFNVPTEGRDLRYYFMKLNEAFAKYLTNGPAATAGMDMTKTPPTPPIGGPVTVPDFRNQFLDKDYYIFDSYGGNASRGEYIDFTSAGTLDAFGHAEDPTDFELKYLILGTNAQSTSFYRKLDREERALFMALAMDGTQAGWGYQRDSKGNPQPNYEGFLEPDGKTPFPRLNANIFETNWVGSPVLAGLAYADTGAALPAGSTYVNPCNPVSPGTVDAYYCATHMDAADCGNFAPTLDGVNPLTRANGKPLLADYCAAIEGPNTGATTLLHFGGTTDAQLHQEPAVPGFEIESTDLNTQTAKVLYAHYANPYDPSTQATCKSNKDCGGTIAGSTASYVCADIDPGTKVGRCAVEVLVPWKPNQEGVGFPVMNTAAPTQDIFVQTAQFDLTGQVVTPVIDFVDECCYTTTTPGTGDAGPTTQTWCKAQTSDVCGPSPADPSGKTPQQHRISIQAIESEDFLGDVFLCVDPGTTADRAGTHMPGDILSAHMWTSVETILDWLAAHPAAQDACSIAIRYSPYNNYPDYIQSSVGGVRLGIEAGNGFGRVSDVTVFIPGLGTPSQP